MKRLITLISFLALGSFVAIAQNLEISHLSDSQTLVRVNGKDRYVLLPVQENAPEANLKVLADAALQQTIDVRLATDQVDYFVPLDLSVWAGKNILLDITMTQGRGFRRDPSDDVCWEEMKTSAVFDSANREAFRPAYHFSPAYGWMNDPNGMVYKDGLWHLFFQYNPYGSVWGNMTWGHAVTKDLVHWEQWDNAIVPNALGAVFSGSAVVDKDNVSGFGHDAIVAMYTSAGASQTQSLAWSNDGGKTFQVYGKNPVITGEVPDFRDPKMFWDEQTRQWKVVLAAGQEVQFWSSDNLKDWTYESSFGQTYGNHNGVWECPDLVQIDGKWVLLLNINPGGPFGGSATQYFVGSWDGHRFTCDDLATVTRWMDYGKDHYATVTWSNAPDGRVVALAWMSNWQYANAVPTQQFRSANSVPRDLSLIKRGKEYILKSTPSSEVEALRGEAVRKQLSKADVSLFDQPRGTYELLLSFTAPKSGTVSFILSNAKGENVVLSYDLNQKTFAMNRRGSGQVKFSKYFAAETIAPTLPGKKVTLRLLVDNCSIEAFGDDFCMTNLVFPSEPYNTLSTDGEKIDVTVYPLDK
ncbi:MAG: DUF4980 domain-containing protein [Bacteroidales bacterium]|nr:DUF4980 domain-containing protein [Bacteroidales bacterium]